MADLDKVLRGWERCLAGTCTSVCSKEYKECEYTIGMYCNRDKLIYESIALLKEYKKIKDLGGKKR